jgi:hypothetical protein
MDKMLLKFYLSLIKDPAGDQAIDHTLSSYSNSCIGAKSGTQSKF